MLANFTEQGMKKIKDLSNRLEAAKQEVSQAGGRMIFWYLTLGQYDFVSVVEVPDAEAQTRLLMAIGAVGLSLPLEGARSGER